MDKIVGIVTSAPSATDRRDDNFVDRLSNRYTVVILVVSAFIVTACLYVGSPITCWAPVHFTGSHTSYANAYCWVRNTYYLPWEEQVPKEHEDRQTVPYYQWIPFILLGQAVLFYLPKILWNGLNQKVGIDADNILEAAHKLNTAEKEDRKQLLLNLITNQLHRCLNAGASSYYEGFTCNLKHIMVKLCKPLGNKFGNYLSLLYLSAKFLYIVNVIGQLFLLNAVLSTTYSIYGIEILNHIVKGNDWTEAPHVAFPRVTYCDFNVRRLGNVHRYTLQCLLPINMYTEKVYMFLWFWMVFVAAVTVLDFLVWTLRYLIHQDKVTFIGKHIRFRNKGHKKQSKELLEAFVDNYLKQDGVFLLRLIGQNTASIVVTDITCKLLELWKPIYENDSGSDTSSIPGSSGSSDMKKTPLDDVDASAPVETLLGAEDYA